MLNIVKKEEYFDWLEKKIADPRNHTLKGIQDAWVLSLLSGKSGLKIAEVGGGRSRILQSLNKEGNECWNIDKFEGVGAGPKGVPEMAGIKVVPLYLGGFDETLPSNYFDVVFSISVVEHVPNANLDNFFADCCRILKPGGILIHAIDLYISDEPEDIQVIKLYRQALKKLEFEWFTPPQATKNVTFECSFASNSDLTMHQWNQIAPNLRKKREITQSVVLKLAGFKHADANVAIAPDIEHLRTLAADARVAQSKALEKKKTGQQVKQKTPQSGMKKTSVRSAAAVSPAASAPVEPQGSVQLASSLLGRISGYYGRWPSVLAVLAILLNTASLIDVIDTPIRWVLIASGTTALLFLIGHAASKADYVLKELEQFQSKILEKSSSK